MLSAPFIPRPLPYQLQFFVSKGVPSSTAKDEPSDNDIAQHGTLHGSQPPKIPSEDPRLDRLLSLRDRPLHARGTRLHARPARHSKQSSDYVSSSRNSPLAPPHMRWRVCFPASGFALGRQQLQQPRPPPPPPRPSPFGQSPRSYAASRRVSPGRLGEVVLDPVELVLATSVGRAIRSGIRGLILPLRGVNRGNERSNHGTTYNAGL